MQCNIDQRGRKARLTTGITLLGTGIALLIIGLVKDLNPFIIAGAVLDGIGLFCIFEGLKGWCALRAIGIKTPM